MNPLENVTTECINQIENVTLLGERCYRLFITKYLNKSFRIQYC